VGCGLQRFVRAIGGGGLVASMAGWFGNGVELVVGRVEFFTAHERILMDILYLLIPLSVLLVLFILGGLWWAIHKGQFDSVEQEGERILRND
jgi:cbb3-type cytochrome oxidase maturation protein